MCVSSESVGSIPVNGGRFGCEGAKCTRATSKAQPFKEAKVSSKKMGLRRVGIVGLSTLVVTSMMSLAAAPSFAAIGDYLVVPPVLNVARGAVAAPAANVTLEFANNWGINPAQAFAVGGNDCSTAAGIAKAVGFNAAPVYAVTDPGLDNNVGDTAPALTETMSSSSGSCAIAGITDVVTFSQAAASTGIITDNWLLTLSAIKYDVGATTPQGNINLATSGTFKASGSVANAFIPIANFTNTARVAAQPSQTGVSLGTQTFTETTAGSFFTTAPRTIHLVLDNGTFTSSITPTITVPTGYTATHPLTVLGQTDYQFVVTGPATPIAATVTVSGLKSDVGSAISTRTITASGMATNSPQSAPVVNVLDFGVSPDSRTGGAERWDTAAALFNGSFGGSIDSTIPAVLASGENFPDALSANYLAGKLGTGTLLTGTASLSQAAELSILNQCVATVYITGGTAAVSQTVADQVAALHVCNGPAISTPHVVVVRLGGADRYATNQLVNEYNFALPGRNTVLLASALNFPDALAVGPVAAGRQMPLIITGGTTLGSSELTQLSAFHPANVVIAGGTAVVSQGIQDSLVAAGYHVYRLGGADRTLTAALVATWATVGVTTGTGTIMDGLGFGTGITFVATGANFPDSLAAGPVAATTGSCGSTSLVSPAVTADGCGAVIVLTQDPTALGAGIPSYVGHLTVGGDIFNLHALGLTAALSASVMQSAAASIDLLN